MTHHNPFCIVLANEKGGTGKSTVSVHIAVSLVTLGLKVSVLDLDTRQRSSARYLENRYKTIISKGLVFPMPNFDVLQEPNEAMLMEQMAALASTSDILIIDSPGRDDGLTKTAAVLSNMLITPINDSFLDLDLLGTVDADHFNIEKPNFYAEMVFNIRRDAARLHGTNIDWVVVRNRMAHTEAKNAKRVSEALNQLAPRVGFRVAPGLSERVIFREMFPAGLTLLDIGHIKEAGLSHVAARQELRSLVYALNLPQLSQEHISEHKGENHQGSFL